MIDPSGLACEAFTPRNDHLGGGSTRASGAATIMGRGDACPISPEEHSASAGGGSEYGPTALTTRGYVLQRPPAAVSGQYFDISLI